jgi:subtilisin family serine protease
VRTPALATIACAASFSVSLVPLAQADSGLAERTALRAALRDQAASGAARTPPRLPLPEAPRVVSAEARLDLVRLARREGPARVLVGLRSHADRLGVERRLRRLGARFRTLEPIGVVAVRAPSAASLVAGLRADPRVAYFEPDRTLRAADPGDAPDPDHFGLKYTWAYDAVRAGSALAAAGGGSRRQVAVIDTGVDVTHPDLAGRIGPVFDTIGGGDDVRDFNGHGTFVAGLVSAVDGNGIGGKGVAGRTKVFPIRASLNGGFSLSDLLEGIDVAVASGADVINLSLAGEGLSRSQARALDFAFFADVLPVAASGNSGETGNQFEFPAAAVGGVRGRDGIGLSVGAVKPNGQPASFSTHNRFVSLAAPGASAGSCEFGVFSTIPLNSTQIWDDPDSCSRVFGGGGGRWAYGEGTSFAAPVAAGIAALAWQVERRLASEQVGDVLTRSAIQTLAGRRWNEFTGSGVVDGKGATDLARVYDTLAPRVRARARRRGRTRVVVRLRRTHDRTRSGDELAGKVDYALLVSTDHGHSFRFAVKPRHRPFRKRIRLRGRKRYLLIASVCDGNGNCANKRLGRFKARRRRT